MLFLIEYLKDDSNFSSTLNHDIIDVNTEKIEWNPDDVIDGKETIVTVLTKERWSIKNNSDKYTKEKRRKKRSTIVFVNMSYKGIVLKVKWWESWKDYPHEMGWDDKKNGYRSNKINQQIFGQHILRKESFNKKNGK